MRMLIATKAANIFAPMLYLAITGQSTVNSGLSIRPSGLWPLKGWERVPPKGLSDPHHQFHLGVDVAADLECSGLRKGFGNILARVLLVAVEGETWPLDINLVDEVVIVGEG